MEVPIHRPESKETYLLTNARKGAWTEVVKLYKEHPEVHKLKVYTSGDTMLHIAVSEGKQSVVDGLVWALSANVEALKVKNEEGNTPLHVAASLGLDRMCDCIASKDSELIGVRNNKGETPFFLAAQRGNRDAFLRLHSICGTERGYEYCRGNGGETILHSTVPGDHFDLAFQIIIRYDKLVNHADGQGLFPFHLLANNPSAFRSGSDLGRFRQFIYDHCLWSSLWALLVDYLKLNHWFLRFWKVQEAVIGR
ncbi:ankyrin repeat-containing protein At5g02620-like [Cornus florida]|uniref:ankyrin repeat-containing protein At5g02620-like n=1 Tax=Cornus florida TaxID=4283 RepID=UPI00289EAB67|nr:ankyrin repeat-containing protein At5g02620-like [Cornus florida]